MTAERRHDGPKAAPVDETPGAIREGEQPFAEPVRLPTEEALDLHPFAPNEIPSVVEEYLAQCQQAGLSEVRLIHGKGAGAQRAVVRRLLATHPDVLSFTDAPLLSGGWGATLVRLKLHER